MFTGIIETLGTLKALQSEGDNLHLYIESEIAPQLHIDQSVAHNGVCLTVVATTTHTHTVTAIAETLQRTNLSRLVIGDALNLERCLRADARIDGHFVQGHIDQTATCTNITPANGSWYFAFAYAPTTDALLVPKGSITIDGVSLTVVDADNQQGHFSVAIIPYTYEHTIFNRYQIGTVVNIEFDIIGKYITALAKRQAYA
ncbi:MAG: riboflavin synthase [Chitinophagales bacterium]|nr:riboflavin synthase [Chitinophagales bacterium]